MRFLMGFVIGLVLGAAAVLLTTPQSGGDLQRRVRSRYEEIIAEGRRARAERLAELQAEYTNLTRRV
jgi:gas vesicle protein